MSPFEKSESTFDYDGLEFPELKTTQSHIPLLLNCKRLPLSFMSPCNELGADLHQLIT